MKKSIKQILCAMLVLVFIFANANVAFAAEYMPKKMLYNPPLFYSTGTSSVDLSPYITDVEAFQEDVLKQLKVDTTGEIDVSKYNVPATNEYFVALCKLIRDESPELFRIDPAGSISGTMIGNKIVTIEPQYLFDDPDYFVQQYEVFVDVTEEMLNEIKGNETLSDVEKALLLHDRLAVYCEYDSESAIPSTSHSAYGAICLGVAVCQGYAYAYDYLLEQVGIEAEYCSSDVLCHAWNIVYIDNKPYHVDVTWDDPTWDMSGRVLHNNFLRSTQGIIETGHIKNEVVDYTTTPIDTTYDNAFWQNSNTAFQLINNKIYYIDNVKQKLNVIDDITDTESETIASLDYKWTNADGSWWEGNYSKLASIRDNLFYSTPTEVYCYNVTDNTSEVIITNADILATTGEEGFRIYGMTAVGCTLWGEYVKSPSYNANTKQEQIFTKGYHNPTENWKTVIEPTSSSQGKEVNTCIDCGREVGSRLIPALDDQHIWSDWYVDPNNKPTCTDKGVILRDCSHCGAQEWDYGTALGHDYSADFTIDIQPTCGITGVKYRACSRCDAKVDITTIPATNNHQASSLWSVVKAATCAEAGYEILPCVNCGAEMDRKTIAQLPHGETELADVKASTCTQEGYSGNQRCKVCKTIISYGTKTAKTAHTSSDWIIEKIATFTQDGVKYRKCTVCGEKLETVTIPKLTHKSDSGTITKQPTCTEAGIKTFKCTKCGEVIKTESIPATGHTTTVINIKAATCTVAGYTGDTYCTTCKTVTNKGAVIPVKAHTLTVVNAKPATFEADGHTGSEVCAVCNQIINPGSVIPKLTFETPTVAVVANNKGINVSWNAVENAQSYIIYRREYNASTKKWSGWKKIQTGYTSTSYVDGAVVLGTNYRYTVRAVNGTAMSAYKSTATLKYNVTPTVKVSNTASGVKVSWSTAANATGYRVYRSTYLNGKWSGWKNMGTAKATKTAWTDKNVKTGVSYKYTVRAVYNKVLSSYNKNGVAVTFLSVPTVKIANNASGIKVAWNKISGATGYVVYSSQYDPATNKWSSWAKRGTVNATSWIDTTVQSGVTYKYTVRAANGNMLSAYKGTSGLMYLAQPTVKIANASKGVKVTWSQSAGALGYTVYRSEYNPSTKKWTKWKSRGTAAADKSSWTDKKVTSGVKYKYTVRAINGNTKSTYVSSGALLYLSQPAVNVAKNGNAITVSWNKIAGATGYRVYRKANNETKWSTLATLKSTSYVDKAVSTDGVYTYTVRAYNGKVWSSYNASGVTISLDYKKAVFNLVNEERVKAGLEPLEYYSVGQKSGDIRAKEVGAKFSHERPDGTMCFTALKEQGIEYYSAGENIAKGYGTPESVMNAWMNSEGHRANILTPGFTHIIVGYDETTNAWVQLFLSLK